MTASALQIALLQQFQEIFCGFRRKFIGQFQQRSTQSIDHLHAARADVAIATRHDVDGEIQQG